LKKTNLPVWLVPAIVLAAILSLYSLYKRHQVESMNKAVSMAAEFETIEALAAGQGVGVEQAIDDLKKQGLNAIVLTEETVSDLIGRGRVSLITSAARTNPSGRDGWVGLSSLHFSDPREMDRVGRGLRIRLGELAGPLRTRETMMALPSVSPSIVRSTSVGLNPEQARIAREKGLLVVARVANPNGVSARAVTETLAWAKENGAGIYLPLGDQVLGRRDALGATIESLRANGLMYASPEFAKIGGDVNVVEKANDLVVRLHSAQSAELDKLPLVDAVERYGKAARERNMRMLLMRPVSVGAEQPLTNFGEFIDSVGKLVQNEGGALGTPRPFGEPTLPRFIPLLIGLAIAPAAWFLGTVFVSDRKFRVALGAILGLLALACWVKTGQQLMTLIGAITFPTLAFVLLDTLRPRNPAVGFFLVSAISMVGGLVVAGMLNGLPYYVGAEEFKGVKVAVFLPILLVGFYFLRRLSDLNGVLKSPITWGTAALGFGVVAVLGLMIARTGNDSGVGASGIEMAMRNLLDRFLFVRPRTKEFMIGHPLLVVGAGLLTYLARQPLADRTARDFAIGGWTALLLMIATMGQTSVVNTLCHLHIPVALSLARIVIGLVLGCMIGLGLWAVVSRLLPKGEQGA